MEDNIVYYVMFFDKDGNHIGYYGTDAHSGGYPWIPDCISQATQFSDYDSALAIAEECYSYVYYDYKNIHKATICELILTPKFSTERETVKKQIADRKIKENLEKIAKLQEEVKKLKKPCKSS